MDETSCVRNVYGELVLEPLQSPSSSSWQCPPWPPARGLLEPPGWSQQVQRAVPGARGSPSLSGATSFHSAHNPSLSSLPAIPPRSLCPRQVWSAALRSAPDPSRSHQSGLRILSWHIALKQIYTTRGAIFEEENDENRISQRKGNKKRTWQKNQQIENCKIKNSPLLHFPINSKDIHYQGWVSKFSLRTLEKANQWPDYWILDTFKTCLLIGLSKNNHDSHDNWQCIDIAMENVCPVA